MSFLSWCLCVITLYLFLHALWMSKIVQASSRRQPGFTAAAHSSQGAHHGEGASLLMELQQGAIQKIRASMWERSDFLRGTIRRDLRVTSYEDVAQAFTGLHRKQKVLAQIWRMGSRPPFCSNKCKECSPCEAVQLPTPFRPYKNRPAKKGANRAASDDRPLFHLDYANYQPEGWKCRCGSFIFNP
ncbi:hypothetical protein KP509_37G002900 [Ceratopteris richardii]|uniref:Epidermal patterning factor-like protein n=1 Tax=Ceratopteris richardii TaxID=49495 RepID=A0A8T2Q5W7_CERRI|nr:hypothetical protein KP509_37G002900 [Ceratopteris richardii]